MGVQQDIESFFKWVADQRGEIDKLPNHFSRILLVSLLDTLARCASPREKSNRNRFVSLVDLHSDWVHKDRVSLPQLRLLLSNEPKAIECQELLREVESRLSRWSYGKILRPEEGDPLSKDLDRFKRGKSVNLIERARYASLVWTMRNFAVHEFRDPGQGWSISDDNTSPYYHGHVNSPSNQHSWELYIPSEVISMLVLSCSEGLKKYFTRETLNPYDSFSFGSSWFCDQG